MVVMALAKAGIAVGIEPQMQQSDIENLLPQETRSALEFFKLQPVDLSRGVFFQSMPAHDFQTNRQPIIQRFIQAFESGREGAGFHFGLEFAIQVAAEAELLNV